MGRYVKVFKPVYDTAGRRTGEKEFVEVAMFHLFGTWGDEGETSPCAVVEFEDGTVTSIGLDMIQFIKTD